MDTLDQIRQHIIAIEAILEAAEDDDEFLPNVKYSQPATPEDEYLEPFGYIRRRADEHYGRGQIKAGDALMERYHAKRSSGKRSDTLFG